MSGRDEPLVAFREAAGADAVAGERAGVEQEILDARRGAPHKAVADIVEGHRLGAAIGEADIEMVLQIVADARHVAHHRDAVLLQQVAGPEPR